MMLASTMVPSRSRSPWASNCAGYAHAGAGLIQRYRAPGLVGEIIPCNGVWLNWRWHRSRGKDSPSRVTLAQAPSSLLTHRETETSSISKLSGTAKEMGVGLRVAPGVGHHEAAGGGGVAPAVEIQVSRSGNHPARLGSIPKGWPFLRCTVLSRRRASNSSKLRGREQLTAGGEGVQAPGAPGAEEGSQGHLVAGAALGAGAAADLPADCQGPQTSLRSVVAGGHGGFGHEDEQFLDELLNTPAQLALRRRWVRQEGTAAGRDGSGPATSAPAPVGSGVFALHRDG